MYPKWDEVRKRIRKVMDRPDGPTAYALSKLSGLAITTITSAVYGNGDTQWNTAVTILAALDLDITGSRTGGVPCETTTAKTSTGSRPTPPDGKYRRRGKTAPPGKSS